MLKKILLSVSLCFCLSAVCAQSITTDSLYKPKEGQPHFILKWAPLSLVEQDNTVQFGIEYLFNGTVSLQQEVGYGWFNFNNNEDNGKKFKNREIWRSRTEMRFYIISNEQITKPKGPYLAIEFLYKRMNYSRQSSVGRECENFDCQYFEIKDYKILKDVFGYHGKIGWQFIVQKRLAIDLYMGGGFRGIRVKSPGLPADVNNIDGDREFILIRPTKPGRYTMISMSAGFKLGYLFYKRSRR